MSGTTPPEPRPHARVQDPRVRRLGVIWLELVLGTTALLATLVIWHLIRRGRLIRERLAPPKDARLIEFEPRPSPSPPPDTDTEIENGPTHS